MFMSLIFKHIGFVISANMKTLRSPSKIQVHFRVRNSVCENTKAKLWYSFERICSFFRGMWVKLYKAPSICLWGWFSTFVFSGHFD